MEPRSRVTERTKCKHFETATGNPLGLCQRAQLEGQPPSRRGHDRHRDSVPAGRQRRQADSHSSGGGVYGPAGVPPVHCAIDRHNPDGLPDSVCGPAHVGAGSGAADRILGWRRRRPAARREPAAQHYSVSDLCRGAGMGRHHAAGRTPAGPVPVATVTASAVAAGRSSRDHEAWSRAVVSRDPRFDGVFYVGISTTGIYCRPVCPARVSYPERRRFFPSAAAAEQEGYRPCLRCRPELAPGLAVCDAVPRAAHAAAIRIAAGALNGRSVADLAHELGVGERHLRRAMERELGVSPVELAQTHRLLLAKCLLTDTSLPVTRVAFASGFQSLRRFNTVFQQRYRLSPSVLRDRPRRTMPASTSDLPGDWIRLTLGYRAPLAWDALVRSIAPDTPPGVGLVDRSRYGRTVALEGCRGLIFLEDARAPAAP